MYFSVKLQLIMNMTNKNGENLLNNKRMQSPAMGTAFFNRAITSVMIIRQPRYPNYCLPL